MKKLITIILIIFALYLISVFLPIKMAVKTENLSQYDKTIFLCKRVDYTGASWELVGDKNGLWQREQVENVIIDGFDVLNELAVEIYREGGWRNIYVIQGEIVDSRFYDNCGGEKQKVIRCDHWDILYPISRGDALRLYYPKAYLTIYDLIR